jgi:penicillin amidase
LPTDRNRSRPLAALTAWDGRYDVESTGALVFELVLSRLVRRFIPPSFQAIYWSVWTTHGLVAQDIAALPTQMVTDHVRRAIREAEPVFARWRSWAPSTDCGSPIRLLLCPACAGGFGLAIGLGPAAAIR